jgi:hypothetical protein
MPFRILVTGSRDWDDWEAIRIALLDAEASRVEFGHGAVLVHGHCPTGADRIADYFADVIFGWGVERYPADWAKHGKAAGPIRNQEMVDLGANICLAFIKNNSRGATHCADYAESKGIEVVRFYA